MAKYQQKNEAYTTNTFTKTDYITANVRSLSIYIYIYHQ